MKDDIKKYQRLIEMQIQKNEYEKLKGFSGEKLHFHRTEELDEFFELKEDYK